MRATAWVTSPNTCNCPKTPLTVPSMTSGRPFLARPLGSARRSRPGGPPTAAAALCPGIRALRDSLTRWAALDERPGVLIHRSSTRADCSPTTAPNWMSAGGQCKNSRNGLRDSTTRTQRNRGHPTGTGCRSVIQTTMRSTNGRSPRDHHPQSKGLEFDHLLPGMVDGRFPMWSAIEAGDTGKAGVLRGRDEGEEDPDPHWVPAGPPRPVCPQPFSGWAGRPSSSAMQTFFASEKNSRLWWPPSRPTPQP